MKMKRVESNRLQYLLESRRLQRRCRRLRCSQEARPRLSSLELAKPFVDQGEVNGTSYREVINQET